jgi:hypothetical protein
MKYVETGIPAFRIDESELLYMRLGEWVVSFEGYTYQWDNDKALGPKRGKVEFCGANLGLIEQCDFNCNDWWSPRYDFDGYGLYFDNSRGNYPFHPVSKEYWERADKYMLWESWAWKKQGFGTADNFWSAKTLMEESVWKKLTDKYQRVGRGGTDYVCPLDIIEAQDLTQNDLSLETIYRYREFDSKEKKNEAIKEYHIKNLEKEIKRLQAIPYGKGI